MKSPSVTAVLISLVVAEKTHFAVSPLDGFEQFYLEMKRSSQLGVRFGKETLERKTNICTAVLNSALIRTRYNCEASLELGDPELYKELEENYSTIFVDYYSEFGQYSAFKHLKFINPYRFFNISVNDEIAVHEPVFSCLARSSASRGILQFFISSEYNVNEDPGHHKIYDRIRARFVFTRDDRERVVVIALAEQPSTVDEYECSRQTVENSFRNETYGLQISDERRSGDDEICKLTTLQKIRVCTTILNSKAYRERLKFLPPLKGTEPSCVLRILQFQYESNVEKANVGQRENNLSDRLGPLNEWMIRCEALGLANNEPMVRYVIRGSGLKQQRKNDKYYVGVEENETETYLESYHYKIGVVLRRESNSTTTCSSRVGRTRVKTGIT